MEKNITQARTDWREQVEELEKLLDEVRGRLVEKEAELADRLAAINAFEFKLRKQVGHLTVKLDKLETEIKKLQEQLRWMGDEWLNADIDEFYAWSMGKRAAAGGEYRYRDADVTQEPQQKLSEDETAVLKKLYRDLARRFHPDMAVDAEDREYRTQLMMAINAAYAAGDIDRLRELAEEPDAADRIEYAQTDKQLAEALQKELGRLQRRLQEIEREMARLERHQSMKMMRQMEQAEGNGRDYFIDLADQIQEKIAQRMVERDILKTQIDSMEADAADFSSENFAENVWDATLDRTVEDEPSAPEFDRYIQKRTDRVYFEEDFDDDVDFD